jgi:hypothetical protein
LVASLATPTIAADGPAFRFKVVDGNGTVIPSANVVLLGEGKAQHLFRLVKDTWMVKGVGLKATLDVTHVRLGGAVELAVPHDQVGIVDFRIQFEGNSATAELLTPIKEIREVKRAPASK